MNTTLRTLALAVPFAASVALGATAANAEVFDPQTPPIIVQPEVEPEPHPQVSDDIAIPEDDGPQGPDDIANPEGNDDPQVPDDKAPVPNDGGGFDGPDDITDTPDCPTHGVDCGGTDEPSDEPEVKVVKHTDPAGTDIVKPTRVDAGNGLDEEGNGAELWLLLAGGAVVATGGAYAARRYARR